MKKNSNEESFLEDVIGERSLSVEDNSGKTKKEGSRSGKSGKEREALSNKSAGNGEKKKKKKSKRPLVGLFILGEAVCLVALFIGFLKLDSGTASAPGFQIVEIEPKYDIYGKEIQQDNHQEMDSSYVEKVSQGYVNFVVLGCDSCKNGINDRGTSVVRGANTDVIMIVSLNKDTGETKIASVYRDTVMYMPEDGTYNKINYAAAKWDVGSTMVALNQNLDLTLTDYVSVNWEAVATSINLLGGVEVDITDGMLRYINGYITETVQGTGIGSTQLTHTGVQTLDGVQAVAYCRVRYTDSDYQRTARQREVVEKMIQKAKAAGPIQLMQVADAVFSQTATTFELTEIFELCMMIDKITLTDTTGYPFYKVAQIYNAGVPHISDPVFAQGPSVNVSQLHEFLYDTKNYQLTQTASQLSINLENMTGMYAPAETTPVHPE